VGNSICQPLGNSICHFHLSAAIEIGALLLTVPDQKAPNSFGRVEKLSAGVSRIGDTSVSAATCLRPSYTPPITPEEFLEVAKEGADLPYLHGRDKTAEKLGISSAEAKRLVAKLVADGRIIVEGKRLKAV
jgi:hypothetical protein